MAGVGADVERALDRVAKRRLFESRGASVEQQGPLRPERERDPVLACADARRRGDEERPDVLAREQPADRVRVARVGEPDDIARAVEYLVTGAPYVTGQIIAVDGGRSISL